MPPSSRARPVPRKPARAEGVERVVHATVRKKDLAAQLSKELLADAPDFDDEDGEVIVVDDSGAILTGENKAASACRAATRGDDEIDVVMIVDAELAERLLDAKVEFDEVLDEVLDEAERSEDE